MNSIDTIFWLFAGFAFVFGAVVGSFLNVVIYRVPAGLSVVHPPSRCPNCDASIRWHDNIPILSWALFLRGKCRDCGVPISGQYAMVEALTGSLTLALWYKIAHKPFASMEAFQQTEPISYLLPFGLYFVFICLLVVITFVDLEHLLIPHGFTLPGIALGIGVPFLFNAVMPPGSLVGFWPPVTPMESIIGAVAGGVTVIAIFYGYFALRGVPGIGGGDVTLMALVGAWLGWPSLVFVFFAASMQGVIAAGLAMLFGGGLLRDSATIFEEDELPSDAAPAQDDALAQGDARAALDSAEDKDTADESIDDEVEAGALAVPFGPFIALAALEFFFVGNLLPSAFSMSYLYKYGFW
ncbi:prepilin signal peptidase PulO-like enzyme (type II secretory pathway) [Bradymonas sediminis]|nr:prepilin signal peptidase PulO-like enzyme (type II secretory pathway) [Bradymonas sediminis]